MSVHAPLLIFVGLLALTGCPRDDKDSGEGPASNDADDDCYAAADDCDDADDDCDCA